MVDDSSPVSIRIELSEGTPVSDRLRRALENLAEAVKEAELHQGDVEGFSMRGDTPVIKIGPDATPDRFGKQPLQGVCIGDWYDEESGTFNCMINWG